MEQILDLMISKYKCLKTCKKEIQSAYELIVNSYKNNKKMLIAGNGGSCSDSNHIVGELLKNFKIDRMIDKTFLTKLDTIDSNYSQQIFKKLQGCLPAYSLCENSSFITAYLNDVSDASNYIYAQQIFAYGDTGDIFLAISTSGNSSNIINASIVAKAKGMQVISLTGNDGGILKRFSDVAIIVPCSETYEIQELHLPIYHCLCMMIEKYFFGVEKWKLL